MESELTKKRDLVQFVVAGVCSKSGPPDVMKRAICRMKESKKFPLFFSPRHCSTGEQHVILPLFDDIF
ncbi:UNVERIFIED_CONTAM: hypothetical protein NCL1_11178 [Trichonephila clavipes]